ncbi:MAG: PIN domain-containing protein [Candidatus Bipolaricaulota bacterium]|nr:PIN domain-containing protein [Candidatus Bipolaricaulota bacterium]
MPERIFVDTGAWIALYVPRDVHHQEARAAWEELAHHHAVTTNYVITEAITAVRRLAGHRRAIELGEALLKSRALRRLYIDEPLERAAWAFFTKYNDQDFSFTDCTSFAVMTAEKIKKAFTFDRDFQIAGFQVLP